MVGSRIASMGDVETTQISDSHSTAAGRVALWFAVAAFLAIAAPLVWNGAPLADDFNNCVASSDWGLTGFMSASWHQLGAIRPARFLEILVGAVVCGRLPFGVAIAVSALTTLTVAALTRLFLRDIGTPEPWCSVGAAIWLLQPLGTEPGLWPAALHVPLGLALSLLSLRAFTRGRVALGWLALLGAAFSVEQAILPLPFAAWLLAPPARKTRALLGSLVVVGLAIAVFVLWPGANPRLHVSLAERLHTLLWDPAFYVGYPAVGLGLHSIPLAIWWARPWSLAALVLGAAVGATGVRRLIAATPPAPRVGRQELLAFGAIVLLANVVVVLSVPHQGSPRVFAPTWLVLSLLAARTGASTQWRRPRAAGAVIGLIAAGAVLSLMFSVSVRVRTAAFSRAAAQFLASHATDRERVAVCGIRRTVVSPAPRGAFAVHEFLYDWAAARVVTYYTGRHLTFTLAGEPWNVPCPHPPDVDVVVTFDQLLEASR